MITATSRRTGERVTVVYCNGFSVTYKNSDGVLRTRSDRIFEKEFQFNETSGEMGANGALRLIFPIQFKIPHDEVNRKGDRYILRTDKVRGRYPVRNWHSDDIITRVRRRILDKLAEVYTLNEICKWSPLAKWVYRNILGGTLLDITIDPGTVVVKEKRIFRIGSSWYCATTDHSDYRMKKRADAARAAISRFENESKGS